MQKHDIVIVIPCRNEEKTISKVVKEAKKFAEVLVVDDASNDNTSKILKKDKIRFIKNFTNIGYEKSLIKGFKFILKNFIKKKYIITLDADGELKPSNIQKLISSMKNLNSDLIIGRRSNYNRFSEKILNYVFFKKYKIYDPISGLKIYKVKYLKKIIKHLSSSMFLVDAVCFFKNMKLDIKNINIFVKKRVDNSRVGNYLTSNLKIIKIIFQI